jgi:hypothetical protein
LLLAAYHRQQLRNRTMILPNVSLFARQHVNYHRHSCHCGGGRGGWRGHAVSRSTSSTRVIWILDARRNCVSSLCVLFRPSMADTVHARSTYGIILREYKNIPHCHHGARFKVSLRVDPLQRAFVSSESMYSFCICDSVQIENRLEYYRGLLTIAATL